MTRARPLPPDQRRAAIVAAARPLFVEHGDAFTTRQVAQAAGIAEGTIFRVFPSKDDLTRAVLDQALDTAPACARLAGIPQDAGLDRAVEQTLAILQEFVRDSSQVFATVHRRPAPAARGTAQDGDHARDANATTAPDASPDDTTDETHDRAHDRARARTRLLHQAIVGVLAPHADQLALPVDQAAGLLRATAFTSSHPFLAEHRIDDASTLARVLLHGMTRPPAS